MCTGWAFYPRVGEWVTRREGGKTGHKWLCDNMLAGFEALGAVDSMVIGLVHFWLEIIVPHSGTSEMGLTASVPFNFSFVILWWEISFYLVFKSS